MAPVGLPDTIPEGEAGKALIFSKEFIFGFIGFAIGVIKIFGYLPNLSPNDILMIESFLFMLVIIARVFFPSLKPITGIVSAKAKEPTKYP